MARPQGAARNATIEPRGKLIATDRTIHRPGATDSHASVAGNTFDPRGR